MHAAMQIARTCRTKSASSLAEATASSSVPYTSTISSHTPSTSCLPHALSEYS